MEPHSTLSISGCTPDEHRRVEQWMNKDSDHRKLIDELEEIWQLAPEEDFQVSVEDAWNRFEEQQMERQVLNLRQDNLHQKRDWKSVIYRAAAVILVVALAGYFFWNFMSGSRNQKKEATIAMRTVTTQRGQQKQITFADGTTVTLNVASTLRFPKNFSDSKRVVYLKGEAYFNVAHDKSRPFIVHTANAKIQVLGTQFNVQAWKNDRETVVGVRSGKVAVIVSDSSGTQPEHVFLTSGQATTVKKGKLGPKRNININKLAMWRNGGLYFSSTPFSEVVKQIERQFDVDIKVQQSGLKSVPFTGTFKHAGLNEMLNVITTSMGIHYSYRDSVIILK